MTKIQMTKTKTAASGGKLANKLTCESFEIIIIQREKNEKEFKISARRC